MLEHKLKALPPGIILHAMVHGLLMGLVTWILYDIQLGSLVFTIIFLTHGLIDHAQACIRLRDARFQSYAGYWYWVLLGIDQFLHMCIIIGLVKCLHIYYGI